MQSNNKIFDDLSQLMTNAMGVAQGAKDEAQNAMKSMMDRWLAEVQAHYTQTPDGLVVRYDPRLRDTVLAAGAQPVPDLWPLFDALQGLPLALIRGANSDLLTVQTADEMARRRPDMIRTDVPGRGHIPFLDEPQALDALHAWLEKMQ